MWATDTAASPVLTTPDVLVDDLAARHRDPGRVLDQLGHRGTPSCPNAASAAPGGGATRSSTTGPTRGTRGGDRTADAAASSAGRDPAGVVGAQLVEHVAGRAPRSPGRRCSTTPARGADRVLLAGPAGAEPPGGHADRVRVDRRHVAVAGRPGPLASRGPSAAARPGRRPGPGSSPATSPSPGRRRSAAAGSTSDRPAAASISRASARVSSTTSAGPPPASTSSDSSTSTALPTARPSGVDMSVSRATVRHAVGGAQLDHGAGQLAGVVDATS